MVKGIDVFRRYFHDFTGQYVLIGGTACDIIMGSRNIDFRATKDLDIVLIIEVLSQSFTDTFIGFINDGNYKHINKGTGKSQFYRFYNPDNDSFPYMIELFSRKPGYLKSIETRIAPIHVNDETMSLSAILLDDHYYELLRNGVVDIDGVSVLNIKTLILYKIKAWLDLSERRRKGESVDSKNIRKHRNDVLRLIANLDPEQHMEIQESVKKDVDVFLGNMLNENIEVRDLGIKEITIRDLVDRAESCFNTHHENCDPNLETMRAINEIEHMEKEQEKGLVFNSVDDLLNDLSE